MAKAFTCSEHGYQLVAAFVEAMVSCPECHKRVVEARERDLQDIVLEKLDARYIVRAVARTEDNSLEVTTASGDFVISREGVATPR